MIELFESVISQNADRYKTDYPFTWNVEMVMRRQGKLKLPDGYCSLPAWQQVSTDCSAVSVAAAIQKLLVKSVNYFGMQYPILAPHPAWLYAVARNQIGKGKLSVRPGCPIDDVIQVIEQYGFLWLIDGIPPYNLDVLNAWTDSIHYKNAGVSPLLYSHYFERFLPIVQKLAGLIITKIPSSDGVISILNIGGTVVIESDMPFDPIELPDRRKLLTCTKRQWERHTTYITDIDNKFRHSVKNIAVARWQIWGDNGEKGEYQCKHETDPSGMCWQTYETLKKEFDKYKATAYGFIIKKSQENNTNSN
ncbi:MAG: hypothetical protein LBP59_11105 [Planctomycetaceae bacterium]|jgi:hypothetical protein|nr:hypothetical protein [Planctomycetaceae bacterium]